MPPQLGEQYRVQTGFDRLDQAAALNAAAGEHLWVLIVTYGLTAEEAAVVHEGVEQLLDRSHLLAVTQIGCYLCELPYEQVVGQKCRGNPVSYGPGGEPQW